MEKEKLLNLLLSELFNAVTEESFLQVKGDNIYAGTTQLDQLTVMQYAEEARMIQKTNLYRALQKHMKAAANQRLYLQSQNTDDMIFGKAMLWNMKVRHEKLVKIGDITSTSAPLKEPDMKPVSPKKTK